jgi:hypothetical protein
LRYHCALSALFCAFLRLSAAIYFSIIGKSVPSAFISGMVSDPGEFPNYPITK